jgi:Ca-activated chloride channel family protein
MPILARSRHVALTRMAALSLFALSGVALLLEGQFAGESYQAPQPSDSIRSMTDGALEGNASQVEVDRYESRRLGRDRSRSSSVVGGVAASEGPQSESPQQDTGQGHFLATPFGGGAFAIGSDDADVWAGLSGESAGVGGLGLVGTGYGGGGAMGSNGAASTVGLGAGRRSGSGFHGQGSRVPRIGVGRPVVVGLDDESADRIVQAMRSGEMEALKRLSQRARKKSKRHSQSTGSRPAENGVPRTFAHPLETAAPQAIQPAARNWSQMMTSATKEKFSTFSVDVDTASYAFARQQLESGSMPQGASVRVEEMINYFDYDYPLPPPGMPVWASSEVGPCPWNKNHKLVRLGVQADRVATSDVAPRNLVFLIDVSGSMDEAGRLPLIQRALAMFAPTLRAEDRISMVVYAGAAGVVLEPSSGRDRRKILAAIDSLRSGGSTNGEQGIRMAYQLAQQSFVPGGINRVMLATDGDFNVGISDRDELVHLIEEKRKTGVYLSVLRVGGQGHSDQAMEALADHGNGNYAYLDGLAEAHKVLIREAGATMVPVADDVKIQVRFDPEVIDSYRLVGYTNRRLAHADFANDLKDAGDVGSDHQVTAIYEVKTKTDELAASGMPLMSLQVRYKEPGASTSQLLEFEVADNDKSLAETSADFRFASAVAEFGERLTGQVFPEGGFASLAARAAAAREIDSTCERAAFVALAAKAESLTTGRASASIAVPSCKPDPKNATPRQRATFESGQIRFDDDEMHTEKTERSNLAEVVVDSLRRPFEPFVFVANYLEALAKFLRHLPLWMCLIPAFIGGVLLGVAQRIERR